MFWNKKESVSASPSRSEVSGRWSSTQSDVTGFTSPTQSIGSLKSLATTNASTINGVPKTKIINDLRLECEMRSARVEELEREVAEGERRAVYREGELHSRIEQQKSEMERVQEEYRTMNQTFADQQSELASVKSQMDELRALMTSAIAVTKEQQKQIEQQSQNEKQQQEELERIKQLTTIASSSASAAPQPPQDTSTFCTPTHPTSTTGKTRVSVDHHPAAAQYIDEHANLPSVSAHKYQNSHAKFIQYADGSTPVHWTNEYDTPRYKQSQQDDNKCVIM